jgi:hypothetical protein
VSFPKCHVFFFEGFFMNHRPIVVTLALALAAGLVSACQGGEDPLPLPPSDASAESSSQHDGGGDAASASDAPASDAESDAAHEGGTTDGGATSEAAATDGGSTEEAGTGSAYEAGADGSPYVADGSPPATDE